MPNKSQVSGNPVGLTFPDVPGAGPEQVNDV